MTNSLKPGKSALLRGLNPSLDPLVVVGDLPSMHFEGDDTPTPAIALELDCAIAQDWADNVLEGRDLSEATRSR
ncbi:hypothetical protein [Phenylobacterium sp.]|uniref:hypothetical protein n=1 Tax=Phenylobacterium sp. TaxID=1871053 RepID=UPI00272391CF|nr:hypothetical protein [Phenylobacterium sp.]MDO8377527.1 hypothetical protein [Phenylobacterium sp.]